MTKIKEYLKGKKVYILSTLGIIYAGVGLYLGHLSSLEAQGIIWLALTQMAQRAGINKVNQ